MIYSMTGYGAARLRMRNGELVVEVRSVNGRYLECRCSMPRELMSLETDVRNTVKSVLSRGNINVFVSVSSDKDTVSGIIDEERVLKAIDQLKKTARRAGITADGSLDTVLRLAAMNDNGTSYINPAHYKNPLKKTLSAALEKLVQLRKREGTALARDLRKRITAVQREITRIRKLAPKVTKAYKKRIRQQLETLAVECNIEFDPVRVITETGVFAERTDITEELIRMDSHIDQFNATLEKGGVVGKRLDFLLQELFREINTTGNKANSAAVSGHVVRIKEEIEKMREQVQNIE
jgi:uncharacterized protein (TIGR00255 family)